ncbi:uncharacterized protein PV09_09292 [Verruconis gallopava]|uniref:Uncharacterized protein n=1 Tax=Verruconis gallopava TaxID=253628 RepID=A0A0D1ZWW4_9PEZI|nr:uncharacterized protein PV09_09292 [Verruconis gallopava]KIV98957.1 hypothetical protein PV09_09292 [Verruconis gallopava]
MASAATQETQVQDQLTLFLRMDTYDWDADEEFKSGLLAILHSAASPEQALELTLRARCFFFTRKTGIAVDYNAYSSWKALHAAISSSAIEASASDTTNPGHEPESGPKLSYQEIVELIQNGKPIPGIKEVPKTVLIGQGTVSTKPARRKPWEKDRRVLESAAPNTPAEQL